MTKAIKVGLHKQTASQLRHHAEQITCLVDVANIVPSMTDNAVRYEQGKYAVVAYVQEKSKIESSEGFNETFVTSLCEQFAAPEFDWRTPIADIMFSAGVKSALETIVRYYQDELGG